MRLRKDQEEDVYHGCTGVGHPLRFHWKRGSTKDALGNKSTEGATGRMGPPRVHWEKRPLEG